MPEIRSSSVIPKPKSTRRAKGSITTSSSYQTVCSITVSKGKTFHLTKITVSCESDVIAKIVWDGEDISIEYYIIGGIPFTDWFPYGWNPCIGDGTKKIELQVKYPSVGSSATCYGEICGEEI